LVVVAVEDPIAIVEELVPTFTVPLGELVPVLPIFTVVVPVVLIFVKSEFTVVTPVPEDCPKVTFPVPIDPICTF